MAQDLAAALPRYLRRPPASSQNRVRLRRLLSLGTLLFDCLTIPPAIERSSPESGLTPPLPRSGHRISPHPRSPCQTIPCQRRKTRDRIQARPRKTAPHSAPAQVQGLAPK